MAQKGFAHLLLLVVVLIVIVGGVYGASFIFKKSVAPLDITQATPTPVANYTPSSSPSPSPVDTTDWKTYSDPRIGFSFKYPADWRFDYKNTSQIYFGQLMNVTVMEFDQEDSKALDPEGKLLGRIQVTIVNNATLAEKTIADYVADFYKNASPISNEVSVGSLTVTEIHHINCSWAEDCVDLALKHSNAIIDFRILNQTTKEVDVKMVYDWLETVTFE